MCFLPFFVFYVPYFGFINYSILLYNYFNNITEYTFMKNILPEIELHIKNGAVVYTVSSGWKAQFIGADFPQLVDDELNIHTPLTDTKAVLSFKCIKGDETAEIDCALIIKGAYARSCRKPRVIPEPAQWYGEGGVMKAVTSYSYDAVFKNAADGFADDFAFVCGKKLRKAKDKGTVCFCFDNSLAYLGEEGYEIKCTKTELRVSAFSIKGAVWAGKTICQLMVQGGFPCGIMRDYPRYSIRGFMLDVGRKPVSMEMLKKIANRMAWYKYNDFHIHLSDNYIWLEDYSENGDISTYNAYQAFRLESDMKNDKGESPTAEDYYYSKQDFNRFIKECAEKGIRITPEIDMPAHALAFTKAFPQYAVTDKRSILMKSRPLTDHIDISRAECVDFVKRIFDEYIKGDTPVFPKGTTVHIGADEFLSDYTAYRNFINELVPYIKAENPVRLWGGLTWIKDNPETPIAKEAVQDVEMNLWSSDWADGREMYDMGYKLINTIDNLLYIVPNGTKIRAPYMDFINKRRAFKRFEPNRVRIKNKGRYINLPAGNKQMLGGCFAIWQDNIDKRSKGITEQDLFERFNDSAAFMAEKNWGSCIQKKTIRAVTDAENAIDNACLDQNIHFKNMENIRLAGGSSFVETGCKNLVNGAVLHLCIKFDEIKPGQIIMEADCPYGTYDLRITENGKLGYTNELYEFEFDYTLEAGKKLDLVIDTKPLRTVLKTGIFQRKKALGRYSHNGLVRKSGIKNSTFLIPVQRIGSAVNSVKAEIYCISVL